MEFEEEKSRFDLDPKIADELRAGVFGEGFMKLVQSVRRGGKAFRISLRPVMIAGVRKFQAEMVDDGQVQVKNFDEAGARSGLEEIIAQKGAREIHLLMSTGDMHVRVSRKGRAVVSRSAKMDRKVVIQGHDRVKNLPLTAFDSAALLRVISLADGSGNIRASMRGKYDQVNEFLKVIEDVLKDDGKAREETFTIVDCGCGKAYLTLSMYFYLSLALGFKNVRVVGIDRREDVIASANKMAEQLDVADKVTFACADLTTYALPEDVKPTMVVSLHACDTATDEALARGVEWKCRYIVSAPCCQHELQKSLTGPASNATFAGLLRQSILRERLCDILTDTFRALILRILGFRTQVVEFVSPDATARNILLRAEYGVKPGQGGTVSEYLNLRDYWKVVPWLETRMGEMLSKHLKRYE